MSKSFTSLQDLASLLPDDAKKNDQIIEKKKGYDGVICGHIHHAEIKEIDGVMYMNDGDWVESCTALVEHMNGKWEIVTWTELIQNEKNINSN